MIRSNESGFTLPELLTVIVTTAFFSGLVLYFGISYWRYGYLLEADLDTFVSRLNAQDFLRETFATSSGLITQNSIPDPSTHNPDPAVVGNQYWLPIHAIPGNTTIGAANTTTPLLYYKRFSVDSSGAYIMNGLQPFEDEYVLYLNGSTKQLLQRSLANPGAAGNRLKTSCPAASASSSCPADKVIISDVDSVDLQYFSKSGNLIDWTSIYDTTNGTYIGPDFPVVEVLELNLHIAKKPLLQKTNATVNETVIRIALRNI